MDTATLILAALVTLVGGLVAGAFVGERAAHRADAAQAPPALAPQPASTGPHREPNAHVHTWRHRSSEDVAGEHVEIYRCLDCAAVERRIVKKEEGGAYV
jgi:hypothetical protein